MAHIELEDINLTYPLRQYVMTLKEWICQWWFRKQSDRITEVRALRNVSLTIHEGETVGIIGHNGAGKSTLLRVIAGIYPVCSGRRHVEGSMCGLFDIAAGFEQEATGWENIRYRGYLQGETPSSIQEKAAQIAEFSELGKFLDVPIKCYSAGMITRLAFSIATAIDPEILLIDEVFATGDMAFQQKAKERLRMLMDKAKVVIMVGHDMKTIAELCSHVVWLEQGRVRGDGAAAEIIEAYQCSTKGKVGAAA